MDNTSEGLVAVGTYTDPGEDGVYSYRFDSENGALTPLDAVPGGDSPSYLAADGDSLFVVNEKAPGTVRAVGIDPETGALYERGRVESGSDGPCHCSVHPSGEYLFVAHYVGGAVSVLPIVDDGNIGAPTAVVEHEGSSADPERQASAHPHSAVPDPSGGFVLVPDLGTDEVISYRFDPNRGTLQRASSVTFPAGAGPRHVTFGPDGRRAYVVTELDSTLTSLVFDPDSGTMTLESGLSTLPGDYDRANLGADVHVHPTGQWVYASNRGHDSLAVTAVGDGPSESVDHEHTRGRYPRSFTVTPSGDWLLVANKDTDAVTTFAVDRADGIPTYADAATGISKPVCVSVMPADESE